MAARDPAGERARPSCAGTWTSTTSPRCPTPASRPCPPLDRARDGRRARERRPLPDGEFVIKPSISGGGFETARYTPTNTLWPAPTSTGSSRRDGRPWSSPIRRAVDTLGETGRSSSAASSATPSQSPPSCVRARVAAEPPSARRSRRPRPPRANWPRRGPAGDGRTPARADHYARIDLVPGPTARRPCSNSSCSIPRSSSTRAGGGRPLRQGPAETHALTSNGRSTAASTAVGKATSMQHHRIVRQRLGRANQRPPPFGRGLHAFEEQ